MLSFSKGTGEKKKIVGLLRNSGHFTEYLRGNVRPKYQTSKNSDDARYSCVNCKGLFLKTYLYRHAKKCRAAQINNDLRKIRHMSAS